jgi:hypothetical protein
MGWLGMSTNTMKLVTRNTLYAVQIDVMIISNIDPLEAIQHTIEVEELSPTLLIIDYMDTDKEAVYKALTVLDYIRIYTGCKHGIFLIQ